MGYLKGLINMVLRIRNLFFLMMLLLPRVFFAMEANDLVKDDLKSCSNLWQGLGKVVDDLNDSLEKKQGKPFDPEPIKVAIRGLTTLNAQGRSASNELAKENFLSDKIPDDCYETLVSNLGLFQKIVPSLRSILDEMIIKKDISAEAMKKIKEIDGVIDPSRKMIQAYLENKPEDIAYLKQDLEGRCQNLSAPSADKKPAGKRKRVKEKKKKDKKEKKSPQIDPRTAGDEQKKKGVGKKTNTTSENPSENEPTTNANDDKPGLQSPVNWTKVIAASLLVGGGLGSLTVIALQEKERLKRGFLYIKKKAEELKERCMPKKHSEKKSE